MSSEASEFTIMGYWVNLLAAITCITLCSISIYFYRLSRSIEDHLPTFRMKLDIALKRMLATQMTPLEIATLAVDAGMRPHDVFRAYVNDQTLRKQIVEQILCSTAKPENNLARLMIDSFPSRFISHGYAHQQEFVNALPEEECNRPQPQNMVSSRMLIVFEEKE